MLQNISTGGTTNRNVNQLYMRFTQEITYRKELRLLFVGFFYKYNSTLTGFQNLLGLKEDEKEKRVLSSKN